MFVLLECFLFLVSAFMQFWNKFVLVSGLTAFERHLSDGVLPKTHDALKILAWVHKMT
jgi:hypothetical protein